MEAEADILVPAIPQLVAADIEVRAGDGDQTVLPELRQLLAQMPEMAEHYSRLGRWAENSWIKRIAGVDLNATESLSIKADQLRTNLAGQNSSPIELLLVDRLVISWLAVNEAELALAQLDGSASFKLEELRIKRLEAAHRRMLSAVKTLATVRRLAGGLRVEIHHHNEQGCGGFAPSPAREQLREALAAGTTTIDRELIGISG